MNEESNIITHLKTLSGRPASPVCPYSVPCDYFSSFTHKLLDRIYDEAELPAVLLNASKATPYSIPDGYFARNTSLQFIKKSNSYQVPAGYFGELNRKIISKLPLNRQPAKVVRKNWWKTVAAAVTFGILVLVSIFLYQQNAAKQKFVHTGNAAADKINHMSTEQLEGFLNVPDTTSLYNSRSPVTSKNFIDFNQLFEKISDKDLKAFLEETEAGDDDFLMN